MPLRLSVSVTHIPSACFPRLYSWQFLSEKQTSAKTDFSRSGGDKAAPPNLGKREQGRWHSEVVQMGLDVFVGGKQRFFRLWGKVRNLKLYVLKSCCCSGGQTGAYWSLTPNLETNINQLLAHMEDNCQTNSHSCVKGITVYKKEVMHTLNTAFPLRIVLRSNVSHALYLFCVWKSARQVNYSSHFFFFNKR